MLNTAGISAPPSLPGFHDCHPYWDHRWQCHTVNIKPGEFYVSDTPIVISTVLGSCISACLYEPELGIGGMNHFMLPSNGLNHDQERSLRYGLFAMEQLINELMKHGCDRNQLRIKLTGGGEIIRGMCSVGQQNINFIRNYISAENLNLVSSDLGGNQARRVAFFPSEGRMLVNKLNRHDDQKVIYKEREYRTDVGFQLDDTDIELF